MCILADGRGRRLPGFAGARAGGGTADFAAEAPAAGALALALRPTPFILGTNKHTHILRRHPDRPTVKSDTSNTPFSRMPRAGSSDQPRVMVGLSGWSAFSGVFICFRL